MRGLSDSHSRFRGFTRLKRFFLRREFGDSGRVHRRRFVSCPAGGVLPEYSGGLYERWCVLESVFLRCRRASMALAMAAVAVVSLVASSAHAATQTITDVGDAAGYIT